LSVRVVFVETLALIGEPADYLPSNCSIESSDPSGSVTSSSELSQETFNTMDNTFLHDVSHNLNHTSEISQEMINNMSRSFLHVI
jgi:hypothetical protein